MTADLSRQSVLFVDNGLFFDFARKVAPAFRQARYYMPYRSAFVKSRQLEVGKGYPEIERVPSTIRWRPAGQDASGRAWESIKDDTDLFVFLDVFWADLQWELRQEGRRVWGCGDAEELELFRWEARQVWKRLGMATLPAERVMGMAALKAYLKQAKPPKFVKQSFTRGDWETFAFKGYPQAERRLEQMEYDLGPIGDDYEFMVEDGVDAPEFGYDGANVLGQFLYPAMLAPEVKGQGMVGRVILGPQELPPGLREVNEKLAPELKRLGCCGSFSTEVRNNVLLDPCFRLGSPSNELLQEMLGDWPMVLWEGSAGKLVKPKVLYKYGAVAMAYAEDSGQNWQELFYPRSIDSRVKVRNPLRIGKRQFAVPQGAPQNLAGIVGVSNTSLLDAIADMARVARQVDGDHVEIALKSMWDAVRILREAEGKGVKWGGGALPSAEELRKALEG